MTNDDRLRVIWHGAIVLLVGLACGYPAVLETANESERYWHTAHEALIMLGTLLLAVSAAMPLLLLPRREALGLVWSLIGAGYGFAIGVVLQGITGAHAFGPSPRPLVMIAFIANATGILSVFLATALTLMGARAARRAVP